MQPSPLRLPITVVAVETDATTLPLTRFAVEQTLQKIAVEEVLFFGCQPLGLGERFVRIEHLGSVDAYSEFIFKCLWPFIATDHAMIVQWDGFVSDPAQWRAEFLAHDYIGAPWAWAPDELNVGNGGFSIRSKRLLLACREPKVRRHPEILFGGAEDIAIGRIYRRHFESLGLSYAPTELAAAFSHETGPLTGPSFGFHAPDNLPLFVPEDALLELADLLTKKIGRDAVRERFITNCVARGYERLASLFRR